MTFSNVSASACEVEEVAATAAGVTGFRSAGGGSAACWRVAGARIGAIDIGVPSEAVVLTALLAEADPAGFAGTAGSSLASIFALISASVFFQSVLASTFLDTALRTTGR